MSLNVSDWFLQLGLPSFLSRHFEAHGEFGLTSSAKLAVMNRIRSAVADSRKRERDIGLI